MEDAAGSGDGWLAVPSALLSCLRLVAKDVLFGEGVFAGYHELSYLGPELGWEVEEAFPLRYLSDDGEVCSRRRTYLFVMW